MTKRSGPTLELDRAQAFMRKVSNNLPNFGTEKITVFTLPLEGIALSKAQLNAFMGPRTWESWFNVRRDGSAIPMPWFAARKKRNFELDTEFEVDTVTITGDGDKEISFESEELDDDEGTERKAGLISGIVLEPQEGGMTLLKFHLQVRPGRGKENLLLQDHQYRHVRITLGEVTLARADSNQSNLPLGEPGASDGTAEASAPATH